MKTEQRYLWVKPHESPSIVLDITSLSKNPDFDPATDTIYELGPEVKLEVHVKIVPANPVYRMKVE